MVVDEISLLPFTHQNLEFKWQQERTPRNNVNIFVSPSLGSDFVEELAQQDKLNGKLRHYYQMDVKEAFNAVKKTPSTLQGSMYPRFDVAIISCTAELDGVIRPLASEEVSLLRARGGNFVRVLLMM